MTSPTPTPAPTPPPTLRRLGDGDLAATRALLRATAAGPAYADALVGVVETAALSPGAECRGIVAELGGRLAAIAVYGEYAGASGAGRLHLVAVAEHHRRQGLGTALVNRAVGELGRGRRGGARGARLILAELPDDHPALHDYTAFLRALHFAEESRVPDFYRPGVALVFLRLEARG